MKSIELDFDGYYVENLINIMPEKAGIYCVYAGKWIIERGTGMAVPKIRKLLYIGQAVDIRDRLLHHDKKKAFLNNLLLDEVLFFSFALISKADLDRAEAALIHRHKPHCNTDFVDNFDFPNTRISCSGYTPSLESPFIEKKPGRPSTYEQMKQQTVYLPADDLKKGQVAAAKSDTTISKVLEVALKEWLDKNY